jgi:molybdenum transport protein
MATMIGRAELERLLYDDAPHGDLTTQSLGIGAEPGLMRFTARRAMVLALVEEAAAILEIAGGQVEVFAGAGQSLAPGTAILQASGPAEALLRGWKVAQTLIEIWSGVATATRAIVDAARSAAPAISVACTRKNTPGVKNFAVSAIRAGGASMHRLGLSETVLVFPEHLTFLAGEPLKAIESRLRQMAPEKKLVIEVGSVEDALEAAQAGFDVIQAEKFPPAVLAELARRLASMPRRPIIAAAGGVNSANAADYAMAGADVLVTSAPYHGAPCDVSVRFTLAPIIKPTR